MNKIFSIADIHGRFDLLMSLIDILFSYHDLNLDKDKLVFTGDYIDRGIESFEVLEYIFKLQKEYPFNIVALSGNHEWLMIDYYEGRDKWQLWDVNGGLETKFSFVFNGYDNGPPSYMLDWIKEMPLYHKEPGFFFSHAPVPKEKYRALSNKGKKFTKEELIWSFSGNRGLTEDEYARKHNKGKTIGVCGHVHALRRGIFEPRIYKHYIFGDSGCGCHVKAPLCAINVNTREVIYSI